MNYLKENHLDDFTYNKALQNHRILSGKHGGQRNHPQHEKKNK